MASWPKRPTIEDVRAAKVKQIKKLATMAGQPSRYDIVLLTVSALGPFLGHDWKWVLAEPVYFAVRQSIAHTVSRPAIIEWLSRPRPEDIAILESLPPER